MPDPVRDKKQAGITTKERSERSHILARTDRASQLGDVGETRLSIYVFVFTYN